MVSQGDFRKFPKQGIQKVCSILGVEDPADFPSHFASPLMCRERAAALAPRDLVEITRILCSERWRHVPRILGNFAQSHWYHLEIQISDLVSAGGDLPPGKVNKATFEELVSNPALVEKLKEKSGYRNIDHKAEVFFDRFVGVPSKERAGKHVLIDGNHRAMHLARQIFLGNLTNFRLKTVVPRI